MFIFWFSEKTCNFDIVVLVLVHVTLLLLDLLNFIVLNITCSIIYVHILIHFDLCTPMLTSKSQSYKYIT